MPVRPVTGTPGGPIARLVRVIGAAHARGAASIVLLAIGIAAFDFISVGSFFPLLTLMFDPPAAQHGWGGGVIPLLRIEAGTAQGLLRLTALVMLLLVTKAVFAAWALRRIFRYCYDVQVDLGHRTLQSMLSRGYDYHLRRNSAELMKNATAEVLLVTDNVLLPAILVLSNGIIVLALAVLLAWIAAGSALIMLAAIAGFTGLLYSFGHRRLGNWGYVREQRRSEMHRVAQQALQGIKTVRTHGAEDHFLRRYLDVGRDYAVLNTRYHAAASIPPLMLDLVMFGGFALLMLFYLRAGENLTTLLPVLGVTGAAAFRILPAGRRIYSDLVMIRYYWSSVAVVERELAAADADVLPVTPALRPIPAFQHRIALDGVCFSYSSEREVLRRVDLDIPARSKLAIVGDSGAGKSTLLDLLVGLHQPSAGAMRIDGVTLTAGNIDSWLPQVGYVTQQIFLLDATVRENVTFGATAESSDECIVDALERAQLWEFVRRLPLGLDTRIGENGVRLSGGERQRLGLARALYRRPRLLILDEATNAVDLETERAINQEVLAACRDLTVIIAAHRPATVRDCDRVALLQDGRIRLCDDPEEVVRELAWRIGGEHREVLRPPVVNLAPEPRE